jgi:hypothetical protein
LGQLQHFESIPALVEIVQQSLQQAHRMVQHEAAEALGGIDVTSSEQWTTIESVLQQGTTDSESVVAESCWVPLDAADYWGHSIENDNHNDEKKDEEKNNNHIEPSQE